MIHHGVDEVRKVQQETYNTEDDPDDFAIAVRPVPEPVLRVLERL